MTDEELQELCDELSRLHVYSDAPERAVAEIKRLTEQMKQPDPEPSLDEDAIDAAFDKWAETRGYGRMGNRLSFHAGVEFGLKQTLMTYLAGMNNIIHDEFGGSLTGTVVTLPDSAKVWMPKLAEKFGLKIEPRYGQSLVEIPGFKFYWRS